MESNNTSLLPYLLSLLGRQSNFCSSIDELCDQVQDLIMEDVIGPYGTLRRAVKFAVAMGVNLGLLSLSDKRVRMPFKLSPKRPATLKTIAKQNQAVKRRATRRRATGAIKRPTFKKMRCPPALGKSRQQRDRRNKPI